MKKLLALLCMITCIFGLTACGSESSAVSESSQMNQGAAEILAKQMVVPMFSAYMVAEEADAFLAEYNKEEASYVMERSLLSYAQKIGLETFKFDGKGVLDAVSSFKSAYESMGAIVELGEVTSEIKDEEIIVNLPVTCEKKSGSVEVIFADDLFLTITSCTINADLTTGEMMEKAGLNTLLGMGTVFSVLVLIMIIIYMFALIPKLQKKAEDKKESRQEKTPAAVETITAAVETVTAAEENLTDDLELAAVIAAAVAAYEGAGSTDGFVVRSIRRAHRR